METPCAHIDEADSCDLDFVRREDSLRSKRLRGGRIESELPVLVGPPAEDRAVSSEGHGVVLAARYCNDEPEAGKAGRSFPALVITSAQLPLVISEHGKSIYNMLARNEFSQES